MYESVFWKVSETWHRSLIIINNVDLCYSEASDTYKWFRHVVAWHLNLLQVVKKHGVHKVNEKGMNFRHITQKSKVSNRRPGVPTTIIELAKILLAYVCIDARSKFERWNLYVGLIKVHNARWLIKL